MTARVKPVNYNISLHDLELGGGFSYQGTVKIDLNVKAATKEIVLNAHQLKVHGAEVYSDDKKGKGFGTQFVAVVLIKSKQKTPRRLPISPTTRNPRELRLPFQMIFPLLQAFSWC